MTFIYSSKLHWEKHTMITFKSIKWNYKTQKAAEVESAQIKRYSFRFKLTCKVTVFTINVASYNSNNIIYISSSDVTKWQSGIVGNVGPRVWKGSPLVQHSRNTVRLKSKNRRSKHFLSFLKLAPPLPTMQHSRWVTSLEAACFSSWTHFNV